MDLGGKKHRSNPRFRECCTYAGSVTSQSDDSPWQRSAGSAAPGSPRPGSASLIDPEDDLPSATYAGDFETTAIPPFDSGDSGDSGGSSAVGGTFGLIGEAEPLPYVQPQSGDRHAAVIGPAAFSPDEDDSRVRAAGRRGTQDLGLLLLRAGMGALLVVHGLQNLFGWWGGQGLSGFRELLSGLGYQYADVLTYVAAGGEIAAGVLLVLGLFTPIAGAAALAYLINGLLAGIATQPDSGSFAFILADGLEYEIALVVVATAIILIGPGRYGLDAGRGWSRRPFIGSFVALLLGIGGGIAVWVLFNGANPLG